MTPEEMTAARHALSKLWGLGRLLTYGEMAHILRLRPENGSDTVTKWESGRSPISGPVSVAVEMMLAGAIPPTKDEALALTHARTSPRGPLGENAVGWKKGQRGKHDE
ncbi:hypothetical protein [Methylobacterium haplocladii]|uniref:Uncharacterized protein n=1 Tax=Methylobacterium haplocladii TaxID=1176176 RepID=A0A512ISC5_9HYPH|nr:hypothetical protein [Methylobacterium haplocladii]GEP00600.1 hypothetical protein MHA02_29870 [Methylobacterium haplocladii]GJD85515.1 hypothetical protein HPGCJGGD_3404 [Methylobacterium haplocladii]GLS57748.1 hypothetical protein GCM10007887_04040 [Methylobacterium haplocladii]